jgi:hypothetical protein
MFGRHAQRRNASIGGNMVQRAMQANRELLQRDLPGRLARSRKLTE